MTVQVGREKDCGDSTKRGVGEGKKNSYSNETERVKGELPSHYDPQKFTEKVARATEEGVFVFAPKGKSTFHLF